MKIGKALKILGITAVIGSLAAYSTYVYNGRQQHKQEKAAERVNAIENRLLFVDFSPRPGMDIRNVQFCFGTDNQGECQELGDKVMVGSDVYAKAQIETFGLNDLRLTKGLLLIGESGLEILTNEERKHSNLNNLTLNVGGQLPSEDVIFGQYSLGLIIKDENSGIEHSAKSEPFEVVDKDRMKSPYLQVCRSASGGCEELSTISGNIGTVALRTGVSYVNNSGMDHELSANYSIKNSSGKNVKSGRLNLQQGESKGGLENYVASGNVSVSGLGTGKYQVIVSFNSSNGLNDSVSKKINVFSF
ncbi:MAG: hypothetical protein ABIG93_01790 [archaeon]|nr:hypothetical protein [Nanoarchaeota archaeon]